jgi:hypothetical protein
MSKWIDGEKGPECFCGMPTSVCIFEDGSAHLMCLFHEYEAGAMFPLPKDARPENWPNIPREELNEIMIRGSRDAMDQSDKELILKEKNE